MFSQVSDFGLSRDLQDDDYYIAHGGLIPVRWTAPEALKKRKYSTASDVWSYGVVLFEIWSLGSRPFGTLTNEQVHSKKINAVQDCSEIFNLHICIV